MRVLMSFCRGDDPFAVGRIGDALRAKLGEKQVAVDTDEIVDDAVGTPSGGIRADTEVVLVLIGSTWESAVASSANVTATVSEAIVGGLRVIPVLLGGREMPARRDLDGPLARLSAINAHRIRPDPDFRADVDDLLMRISASTTRPAELRRRSRLLVGSLGLVAAVSLSLLAVQSVRSPGATEQLDGLGPDDSAAPSSSGAATTDVTSTSSSDLGVPTLIVNCGAEYRPNDRLPLRPCDKGLGVELLQQSLRAAGASVDIDGFYGQGTTNAVLRFQARVGLPATGTTDGETWVALVGYRPGIDLDSDGVIGPNEMTFD